MTLPSFLFGVLLAAFYAAIFHFWGGDKLRKLILYLLLAQAGFWSGHILGAVLGWTFAAIGPLNAGMGTVLCFLVLTIGRWLSQVEVNPSLRE